MFPIGYFPNKKRAKASEQDDLLKTWSGLDNCLKPFARAQWKRAVEHNSVQCIVNSDGSHFVARKKEKRKTAIQSPRKKRTELDEAFADLYRVALREDMCRKEQKQFIKENLESAFSIFPDLERWIEDKLDRERHNYFARRKRFLRKAYLHKWNYFVTITYDSKKYATEEEFRKKLRKCLSNLHTRRDWRYMGVFEYSPKKNRLHFHALMQIPEGQFPGEFEMIEDYSTKRGKRQKRNENTFFRRQFGVNDFAKIDFAEVKRGRSVKYLIKYLEKSGERIVYSRNIPTEIEIVLHITEIAAKYWRYGERYVLFDDHFIMSNIDYIDIVEGLQTNPYDIHLLE